MTRLINDRRTGSAALSGVRRGRVVGLLVLLSALAACSSTPGPSTSASTGAATSASSAPVASAETSASPSATLTTPVPTATTQPSATTTGTGPCATSDLRARIVNSGGAYWTGAAGSRGATFSLENVGAKACTIRATSQPELVNGDGFVLILGSAPASPALRTLPAGGSLTTLVVTSNLCGAPPIVAPVRVAFVLGSGSGTVTANAVSETDAAGVPPCNADPAVHSGSITMQAWHS